MKYLFLIFLISFNLLAKIEFQEGFAAYEFELLLKQLDQAPLSKDMENQIKAIDIFSGKLNKKGSMFFFKNSIYKSILKNTTFSKTRTSLTQKEFIRTLNKFNDESKDYSLFSKWIIESVLVELNDLNKATTPEEYILISRNPDIKKNMELTSNLVLDFLNLSAKNFNFKIQKLSKDVLRNLYQDALILANTLKIDLEQKPARVTITDSQILESKNNTTPAKNPPTDDYLPTVDPSSAINDLKIDDQPKWKPKK